MKMKIVMTSDYAKQYQQLENIIQQRQDYESRHPELFNQKKTSIARTTINYCDINYQTLLELAVKMGDSE